MNKHLLKRTITVSIIFGILFFLINYFSDSDVSAGNLMLKSLLTIVVFGILYYLIFTIVNSPERKYKFGITLPISLLIAIIISAMFSALKICIITGLIIGIIAGYIWEYIDTHKNGGDKS